MRRTHRLTTLASGTALGTLLFVGPALSQPAPGQGDASLRQMRQEQQLAASPGLPAQRGAVTEADRLTAGPSNPSAWVAEAQEATRRNRTGAATELLERAETRLLTRVVPPAGDAERPMRSPAVERLSAARAALQARDRAGALREMDLALAALASMPSDDMATGTGTGMAPMQGGGTMMMHDGGMGARSMSRADAIIRVQAGGGGGGGEEGSGGLPGSTPGSPGVGSAGSTPGPTRGSPQQPAMRPAQPGVATNQEGAPPPGSLTPTPGMTGSGTAMPPATGAGPGGGPSGGTTGTR
jgi:hypothetical protein